jgi:rhodanese-related sulfurtransferase
MSAGSSFRLLREVSAILLTAVALGVAYNSASPLGVRAPSSSGSVQDELAFLGAMPETENDPAIHNETIQALLVPSTTGQPQLTLKRLPPAMTWREVKPLVAGGRIVLVDGRDAESFALGHIPGAVSLPMDQLQEKVSTFTAQYPKETPLVIYCASIRCQTANIQARALAELHGYSNVGGMPGGFAEWRISEPHAEPAMGPPPP